MKINISIPSGISYPTIAVIPFAKGAVSQSELLSWNLLENGRPIRCYREIVALWPDESIKWVHVHGIYSGIKEYDFKPIGLEPGGPPAPIPPDSALDWEAMVEDSDGTLWKNTRDDRNALPVIPFDQYKITLFNEKGGWEYNDLDETKFEEISNNNFIRVTRYEGWLKSNGIISKYRYCTRVTRYADHPLVKFSHSIVFAGNMRGQKITHVSFKINHSLVSPILTTSVVDGTSFDNTIINFLEYVRIHQARFNKCYLTLPGLPISTAVKADGCIKANELSFYVRDFWQKFPQSITCRVDSITYRQWHGNSGEFDQLIDGSKERLLEKNLHKLLHWHQGPYLENDIPKTNDPDNPEWADLFYAPFLGTSDGEEGGPVEEFIEYTDHADIQGRSIHDDFAIHLKTSTDLKRMSHIWNRNPVGSCDPAYIEETEVSDFGAKSDDFTGVENFIEDSIRSYTDPGRFENYGRFLYGESHRHIFVNFDRPSRHRLGLASYYCSGETYWRLRLRGGSNYILDLARRNTEHYRAIVQDAYHSGDPSDHRHKPGGVWYRGLWWGSLIPPDPRNPPPGLEYNDGHSGWNTKLGRIIDPDSLLWSWILDGNRFHLDGYLLWYKDVGGDAILRYNTSGRSFRETNKTLVYSITAFEYFTCHPIETLRLTPDEKNTLLENLQTLGNGLLSYRLDSGGVGPLWQPEWIRTYIEFLKRHFPGSLGIMRISEALNYAIANYNGNLHEGQSSLDMTTLMLDIYNGNYDDYNILDIDESDIRINDSLDWISRLSEKIYKGEDDHWYNFGIGDGELGDTHVRLLWGAFLKRLRRDYDITELPEYDHYGHYPCSVQYGSRPRHLEETRLARGNEFRILKLTSEPLAFKFKFPSAILNRSGDNSRGEILVLDPTRSTNVNPLQSIVASKLISFFIKEPGDIPTTDVNYPSALSCGPVPHTCTLPELRDRGDFVTYSLPHNIRKHRGNFEWERGNRFMTEIPYDVDSFRDFLDTTETGVCKVFIIGSSVYTGLTVENLPEAMVLTNYSGSNDESGDYMFGDSMLFYKNLGDSPVTMRFWASVFKAYESTMAKWGAGAFARVKEMNVDNRAETIMSHELVYKGTAYGDMGPRATIVIPPHSVKLIKTICIYGNTIVRAKIDGRLLCARTMNDINALS